MPELLFRYLSSSWVSSECDWKGKAEIRNLTGSFQTVSNHLSPRELYLVDISVI